MTEAQVTSVTTALTTATQSVLGDFIQLLPAIAIIVGAVFVIKFVSYWMKKIPKSK